MTGVPNHDVVLVLALHNAVVPHQPRGCHPHCPLVPRELNDVTTSTLHLGSELDHLPPDGCVVAATNVNVLGFDLGGDGQMAWGLLAEEGSAGGRRHSSTYD